MAIVSIAFPCSVFCKFVTSALQFLLAAYTLAVFITAKSDLYGLSEVFLSYFQFAISKHEPEREVTACTGEPDLSSFKLV
ncbi:hypothetical protein T09_11568 [Trichinella sp. T9]|nr:hypothetical protein T09_11568 [Trichinella sp. T9]